MDGFAVRSADFAGAAVPLTLELAGESKAGLSFQGRVSSGQCVAIYTGAELPRECDAVVMVEKSAQEGTRVRLDDRPRAGQHVCHMGEDLRSGARVLGAGTRLRPIELSVLAAVGCDPVPVFAKPRVGLFTTGDELVPARERPARGQIREGNTHYLAARAELAGAEVRNLGIVGDDERELERAAHAMLESSDVVITTGGVSMGKYDLVGAVLERAGVEPVFHKVAIKPGKPLWFGMRGRVPVFALPGNPVSCLIGFEVFVRPALAKLEGACESEWRETRLRGRWKGSVTSENPRQQNLPVRVVRAEDGIDELEPLDWKSSADIVGLTRADGLAIVEASQVAHPGELLAYRPLR